MRLILLLSSLIFLYESSVTGWSITNNQSIDPCRRRPGWRRGERRGLRPERSGWRSWRGNTERWALIVKSTRDRWALIVKSTEDRWALIVKSTEDMWALIVKSTGGRWALIVKSTETDGLLLWKAPETGGLLLWKEGSGPSGDPGLHEGQITLLIRVTWSDMRLEVKGQTAFSRRPRASLWWVCCFIYIYIHIYT